MKRIHDGAIGDIVAGPLLLEPGRPLAPAAASPSWTDMEWQLRNWYYFTWLSGDHIVEQHVHNLDVVNWAMGDATRSSAVGMGGRQVRTGPAFGHIFDHFAVDFEYPNGVHVLSMCRQIDGCANNVSEALVGTKATWHGEAGAKVWRIEGPNRWRWRGKEVDPYLQEHIYMTMRSDVLTAYYDQEMKQMKQVVLDGKVNATQGTRVATGDRAVFDDKAKTVTLTGNPVMRQGNNQVSGAKVVYFIEQDRAMVESDGKTRVSATIFPEELKVREQGDAKSK